MLTYQINDIKLSKLTLFFEKKNFEKEFTVYRSKKFTQYARYSFWLTFLLLIFFMIKDYLLYPFYHFYNVYILFIFPVLFIILSLLSTYFSFFKKVFNLSYILIITSYSYCLFGSMIIVPQLSNIRHLTIIIIMLGCYVMTHIQFVYSSILCFILLILYIFFAHFFEKTASIILINNLFFILIANIIGMFFCYKREYLLRLNFLRHYLLRKTELLWFCKKFDLTKREEEIISFILKGKSIKEIAEKNFISPKTVKTHLQNIYAKTGLHSKVELFNLFQSINPDSIAQ